MLIVSVMLVAALNAVGSATRSRQHTGDSARGRLLAQDLMAEILLKEYDEPDRPGSFGKDAGESATSRANYDDVDDYHGWKGKPPQRKDGTAISGLDGWTRMVTVDRVDRADVITPQGSDTGLKLITVSSLKNELAVSTVSAIKSRGLPTPADPVIKVLMVVVTAQALTAQESARKTLLESWGMGVSTINANSAQPQLDQAAALNDLAYVSEEINAQNLGTKLRTTTIGVVNEDPQLVDEFGFASTFDATTTREILVTDNTHYITSGFDLAPMVIVNSSQPVFMLDGFAPADLEVLAGTNFAGPTYKPSLAVRDAGDALYGGGTAAGRRVQMPWGDDAFDFNELATDGRKLLMRALTWAAGKESTEPAGAVCGDKACDAGENACNCPGDCGPPDAFEVVAVTCDDGLDNDCDADVDCDDANCTLDVSCVPICGNGTCNAGESCLTCALDCAGVLLGPLASQHCCGNGTLEPAEGDGTICDGNP